MLQNPSTPLSACCATYNTLCMLGEREKSRTQLSLLDSSHVGTAPMLDPIMPMDSLSLPPCKQDIQGDYSALSHSKQN